MGPVSVWDTNIVIYFLEGRLAENPDATDARVSIVTETELLSHDRLDPIAENAIRTFLASVPVVELTAIIKDAAI